MIAGTLKEPITVQRNESTRSDYGSIVDNWVDHIKTRASIAFSRGSRRNMADEIVNLRYAEIRIRLYHQIDPKMRIIHRGLKYGIISAFPDRNLQAWIINAEQINE